MSKSYRQYCPIAHALDLVGDRAAFVGGGVLEGAAVDADPEVESDAEGLQHLVTDRDLDAVAVRGRRAAVLDRVATLPERNAPLPATERRSRGRRRSWRT